MEDHEAAGVTQFSLRLLGREERTGHPSLLLQSPDWAGQELQAAGEEEGFCAAVLTERATSRRQLRLVRVGHVQQQHVPAGIQSPLLPAAHPQGLSFSEIHFRCQNSLLIPNAGTGYFFLLYMKPILKPFSLFFGNKFLANLTMGFSIINENSP